MESHSVHFDDAHEKVDVMKTQSFSGGFTLIELMVVVSLIALLVALLLPTLGQARSSARAAQCLSNLRQFGMLTTMYRMDHNDTLPTWRPDQPPDLSYNASRRAIWQWAYAGYMSMSYDPTIPEKQPKLYLCPDTGPVNWQAGWPWGGNYRASYTMNFLGSDWKDQHWGKYAWLRASRVTESTFHLFADINPSSYPWYYTSIPPEDITWQLAFRHQSAAQFMFLDGHADTRKVDEYTAHISMWGSMHNKRQLGF